MAILKKLPFLAATLSAFVLIGGTAQASEHGMTRLLGEKINLAFHDHGIAGSVGERLVFGSMLSGEFGSMVTVRDQLGVAFDATFRQEGEEYVGRMQSSRDGETRETVIRFLGIDRQNQILNMEINGEATPVQITAEGMDGNHFVNPSYSLSYQGEAIEFTIEDGSACYGCSVNLVFMIVGAYIH